MIRNISKDLLAGKVLLTSHSVSEVGHSKQTLILEVHNSNNSTAPNTD